MRSDDEGCLVNMVSNVCLRKEVQSKGNRNCRTLKLSNGSILINRVAGLYSVVIAFAWSRVCVEKTEKSFVTKKFSNGSVSNDFMYVAWSADQNPQQTITLVLSDAAASANVNRSGMGLFFVHVRSS